MIKTKDQRQFFTEEEHLPQLIEFSKIFGAEISIVKVDENKIRPLEELPEAICDASYEDQSEYELVKIKIAEFKSLAPEAPTKRKDILALAAQIKNYIVTELLSKGRVTFAQVEKKFSKYNLSKPTISNHIRRIKEEMAIDGYEVVREKRGEYSLQ
jgi:DNA-binding transcriptional ArsR family regulator